MRSVLVLFFLFISTTSYAACGCFCVNGEVKALCDNSFEITPICAPRICPITPPEIDPIMNPNIPPVGTQSCHPVQVWDGFAMQYKWRVVCK